MWHHKTCVDLCTADYELLNRSNVQWICCKCESINVTTFTFHSYISESNYFTPLTDNTIESITSNSTFSPITTSSPRQRTPKTSRNSPDTGNGNPSPRRNKVAKHHTPTSKSNISDPYTITPIGGNLRVLTVNCRSLLSNSSELKACINYTKPNIVCGTESWLRPDIKSSEVFHEDYVVYRKDRCSLGGGVFIMIHKDLTVEGIPQMDANCEIIWVKVNLQRGRDIVIGSFYMPHRRREDIMELQHSLERLPEKTRTTLLTGDFNCPDIVWQDSTVKKNAQDSDIQQSLFDLMSENQLAQLHDHPTRGDNMLDLVFTTNPSLIKSTCNIPGISDHDMIVTDLLVSPQRSHQKARKCFSFQKANWDNIKQEMMQLSDRITSMFNNGQNINELWLHFKDSIARSLDKHVPSKTNRNKNSLPWINSSVKRLLRRKARIYKQAKKTGNWRNYRFIQKECKREIRRLEWTYINETITAGLNENNTKPFWKYIKSKKQENIGVSPLKEKGSLCSDSVGKANILIKQFSSVFTRGVCSVLPSLQRPVQENIPPLIINAQGIYKLLSKLNTSKAIGPDNIPTRILKECAQELAPGLTTIFQLSLDTGTLPEDWLHANITPVYKKGDKHLAENYRPVSLTSVTCKTLEHIVCSHILSHFDKHNVLTSLNHGFRSGYSCETQLLITAEDFFKSYDQGTQMDVAILDFSKAFDTVPHDRLLHKLDNYGIRGNTHSWIKTFLTERRMRVVLDGEYSQEEPVLSGVPQGTVLGPLLFLCHINDLPEAVSSQVRLFADDCLLYRKIKTYEDHNKLQQDLHNLEKWASDWGMRFNSKKCYILSIKNKTSHYYSLGKDILKQVPCNPYLGVLISEDLKWANHINKITKTANYTMGFLHRNLRQCTRQCRRTAYISLVRSILEYGAIIWDPHCRKDIDKLEKVQHRAARFITGDYRTREKGCVTSMLKDLHLQSLEDRRRDKRLTFLYKLSKKLVPAIHSDQYLTPVRPRRQIRARKFENYQSANIIERQATNHNQCFTPPRSTTEQYKHSFFPKTIIEWNNLDSSVAHAESVEAFTSALQARY